MRIHDDIHLQGISVKTLPATIQIAHAHLRISDLRPAVEFYRDLVGLTPISSDRTGAVFSGTESGPPVLLLTEERDAAPRDRKAPGLFHLAFLYSRRSDLARALQRISDHGWTIQGFADHGVSEALYLADPDGNGVELTHDRPRANWPFRNGNLQMVTEPLDVDGLLAELHSREAAAPVLTQGIRMGHMHLQVSDLHRAEQFYHGVLGFDVTQKDYPGALFLAAGSYHHHIGLNVWNSRGARPSRQKTLGLGGFALQLSDALAVHELANRCRQTSFWAGESERGFFLHDTDGHQIEILHN